MKRMKITEKENNNEQNEKLIAHLFYQQFLVCFGHFSCLERKRDEK